MNIDTHTLAAIVDLINGFLKIKNIETVKKIELVDLLSVERISKVRNNIISDKRRVGKIFTILNNLYNSGVINMETINIFIFDEFIRTDTPMDIFSNKNLTNFKNVIRFNSILDVGSQMNLLEKLKVEFENQPKIKKFSGNSLSLFKVVENQKNRIYELVRNGKINCLIYTFLLENYKFTIDENKIDDLSFLKFIKIIKYIKNIKIQNIKYEV